MLLVLSEKNNRPSLRISTVLMKSTPLMKGINVTGFYGSLLRVNGVAIDEECAGATKRYGDNATQLQDVTLVTIHGGGHTVPSIEEQYSNFYERIVGTQNHDVEMAELVWGFLKDKAR